MKKLKFIFPLLSIVLFFTSCLKHGLEQLPNSDLNAIVNIAFEHRWIANNQNGYETLCRQSLTLSNNKPGVTPNDKIIQLTMTVPPANDGTVANPSAFNSFKTSVRNSVVRTNLYLTATISPAAKIEPLNGAPLLGLPGDFSAGSYKYQVTSASGQTAIYTIVIDAFLKP